MISVLLSYFSGVLPSSSTVLIIFQQTSVICCTFDPLVTGNILIFSVQLSGLSASAFCHCILSSPFLLYHDNSFPYVFTKFAYISASSIISVLAIKSDTSHIFPCGRYNFSKCFGLPFFLSQPAVLYTLL